MTDLDKLKELAAYNDECGTTMDVDPLDLIALIERLEAAEKRVAELEKQYDNRTPTEWAYTQACAALEKHRARANKAEAELARRNAAAGEPVLYQKLNGHDGSWSECSKDWYDDSRAYHRDFNEGAHLAPVRALFTAAQPAALPPIKLPKIKHPAQFDYADELIASLKAQGFTVEGDSDE